ncbi:MAG: hypothetical protein AAFY43_09210 [Pseudomonadota bacterium]
MRAKSMKSVALGVSAMALFASLAQPTAVASNIDRPSFKVMGIVIVWGADGTDPATATAPVVSDFVIDTGSGTTGASSGDTDLINGDVYTVVTGSLAPVENGLSESNGAPMRIQRAVGGGFNTDTNNNGLLDGGDAFSAFGLRDVTDTNTRRAELTTSFYVASNTAFNIDAEAFPATEPFMDQIRVRVRTSLSGSGEGVNFGSAAQFPHSDGAAGGGVPNGRRLSRLTPGGNQRIFRGNQRTAASAGSIADQSVRFDMRYLYRSGNIDLSDGVLDADAEVHYTVFIP